MRKGKRLHFEWYCNKVDVFQAWEIPCNDCDRSCDNLEKISAGRRIPGSLRDKIFSRDNEKCLKCGSDKYLSLDHIRPLCKDGSNGEDNLQTLCESCNQQKGEKIIDYRKNI